MERMNKPMVSLVLLSLVTAFSAGADLLPPQPSSAAKLKARHTQLEKEISKLVKTSPCSSKADCGVAEVGVKPCGGPWSYKIYSKKNVRSKSLEKKVAEFNALDKSLNEKEELMSDCSVEMQPEVACVKNACTDVAKP
jgi:hypothetical protein